MKKRIFCTLLAMSMVYSMAGCAASSDSTAADSSANSGSTASASNTAAQTSYSGTVTAISSSSITVSTDSGDSVTAAINDSTTITRGGPGGMGGAPGGDGQAPQMPGGDSSSGNDNGGTPPEKPDGDTSDTNGQNGQPQGGDASGSAPQAPNGSDSGSAPQAPNGSSDSGSAPQGNPPEKPDGDSSNTPTDGNAPTDGGAPSDSNGSSDGSAPQMPQDGQGAPDDAQQSLTTDDIAVGDTVTLTLNTDGTADSIVLGGGEMGGMGGPGGGMSSGVDSYDAATEYTTDAVTTGETYTSSGSDENAVHVYEGAAATLDNATITRDSDDSTGGDNSSFYGVGAAALVTDGTLKINNSTITTDAKGGAGVFAYGSGTAYVSDTSITTQKDTSGGIHVAGGGTLYAWDLDVETNGESSAAIRSDRGSGTMVVDGGSYTSNGVGSPAIYSTADITVNNADLTANGSEAICIEGLNTIRLFDCNLTGSMADNSQNDCTWNVILYQSMSGDSEVGNSTFEMVGGSLTAKNGGMFYTTNTESTFLLQNVAITNADDSEFFLKCTGNANQRGWGTTGQNGADCTFTARQQEMTGDVIWDSISQLDLYVLDGSTLTGAVLDDESNAGNGGDGYAALYLDDTSKWVVTGDSTVTNLYNAGTIVDASGNTVTVVGTDGTVYVQGTSQYTVTVTSYSTSVDTSAAATADSWSDYEVEKA